MRKPRDIDSELQALEAKAAEPQRRSMFGWGRGE